MMTVVAALRYVQTDPEVVRVVRWAAVAVVAVGAGLGVVVYRAVRRK